MNYLLSLLSSSAFNQKKHTEGCNVESLGHMKGEAILPPTSDEYDWDDEDWHSNKGVAKFDPVGNVYKKSGLANKHDAGFCVHALQSNLQNSEPLALPVMVNDSLLLSDDDMKHCLYCALPNLVKGRHWVLLYSTAKHGISLQTLYRRSATLAEPFLLVVRDGKGAVFGGLTTAPLKPTFKRKYQGTNEMFVFTNVSGSLQIFRATGSNRFYFLCTNNDVAFGGGGHFALHLDEDLLNGSSGPCDTYNNICLATTEIFYVANIEVWGFAHPTTHVALHNALQGPVKSDRF